MTRIKVEKKHIRKALNKGLASSQFDCAICNAIKPKKLSSNVIVNYTDIHIDLTGEWLRYKCSPELRAWQQKLVDKLHKRILKIHPITLEFDHDKGLVGIYKQHDEEAL